MSPKTADNRPSPAPGGAEAEILACFAAPSPMVRRMAAEVAALEAAMAGARGLRRDKLSARYLEALARLERMRARAEGGGEEDSPLREYMRKSLE